MFGCCIVSHIVRPPGHPRCRVPAGGDLIVTWSQVGLLLELPLGLPEPLQPIWPRPLFFSLPGSGPAGAASWTSTSWIYLNTKPSQCLPNSAIPSSEDLCFAHHHYHRHRHRHHQSPNPLSNTKLLKPSSHTINRNLAALKIKKKKPYGHTSLPPLTPNAPRHQAPRNRYEILE